MKKVEPYRWVILIVVYLSILAFALLFQSIPPLLSLILSELHLTYVQSGLLMSLFALPGLFLSLFGGVLSDRYGMKPLGMICFFLMMVGTFMVGMGMNLWILGLGRILAGMGAFTLSVFLPKLLSIWFKGRELGLAMGIYNTGVPLGSVICFGLFGKMGTLWGWRIPIFLTGVYLFFISMVFLTLYRLPSPSSPKRENRYRIYLSLKEMGAPIWWIAFSWLWFNAGFISFATFGPSFFLKNGYTLEQSDFLIGIPLLGSLFLSTPIGYFVDRFRHQEWLIAIGGLGLSILTLSFNLTSSFLLLVILMGVFSALIPSPIYSLPPEILRAENLGLGFGVISTCSSLGLFIAPYWVGKIKDVTESDHWSFVLISFFFILITIFILFSRLFSSSQKNTPSGRN